MSKIILLVEDNPDDELLTTRALKKSNIANEVITAHDGVEALEYLFETNPSGELQPLPAVILLDLKLPRVDGLEVLRRIRGNERTKRLPVVILTSSDEESDLVEGYQLGANSYVRKPVDFAEFSDAVKNVGLYWLLINRTPNV